MNFKPIFIENECRVDVQFGEVQTVTQLIGGEIYDGSYEVVPQVAPQTLETQHKVMNANVTVHEIPYAEVTNTSGGMTATIG